MIREGCGRYLLAVLLIATVGSARAVDSERGRTLYYSCESCHWADGSGSEALGAPAIAGLDQAYVARQLRYYRDGQRGYSLEDLPGRQMTLIAAIFTDDADVDAVAEYVAAMEEVRPARTVDADVEAGRARYIACIGCHGANAEGNPALSVAAMTGVDDWYLVRQMAYYRDGLRGTAADDIPGQQMRPFAVGISDDDIAALAAYITSLNVAEGDGSDQ